MTKPYISPLAREAATLIIAGIQADHVDEEARALVAHHQVGGLILFRRNIHSPEQTHALISELKGLRASPLLLSVDQEGGRVQRLRSPFTEFPPMRALGDTNDLELARLVGAQLGREVRSVGFDLDFAPVVDVDTNPKNPVIGDRSFATRPDQVAAMATAVAAGLKDAGVMSCAKHFPGHGDTQEDSHHHLPRLKHSLQRLRDVEWPPFRALAAAGVDSIMTAHVVFDALQKEVPATLSEPCISALRTELGFSGPIISDDLEMKAIADRYQVGDAGARAVAAGCDVLLVCHSYTRIKATIEALVKAREYGEISTERWEQAMANAKRLRAGVHAATPTYVPPAAPTGRLAEWLASYGARAGIDPTEAVQHTA